MPAAVWLWLPAWVLCCGLLPAAAAAPADAGNGSAAEGKVWMQRINTAAAAGNYRGIMVFSAAGVLSSSRVAHYAVGDQVYEQLEALDGRQQRILRHNDAVHTLWPQARLAVIEKRESLAAWSTTPQDVDPRALSQYEFWREGVGRVAGREASVILLEPRDALRYAQRLWADQATGLLLRADVMGQGEGQGAVRPVLESTAFSEVAIGVRPQPEAVLQPIRSLEGYRVLRPAQRVTTLETEGWELSHPVAGFRLAGCMMRGMADAAGAGLVLQAVFTDGLTHVSLFVEPYRPEQHDDDVLLQQGATSTLMTRRGDDWVTVVGDVPAATLRLFAVAAERRRP